MVNQEQIRVSKEFKGLIDVFRGKCLFKSGREVSISDVTKVIASKIDIDKIIEEYLSEMS